MMHNEIDGEQVYQIKTSNNNNAQKNKMPSRGSIENTESENDMPDIDDEPEALNGNRRQNGSRNISNHLNAASHQNNERDSQILPKMDSFNKKFRSSSSKLMKEKL